MALAKRSRRVPKATSRRGDQMAGWGNNRLVFCQGAGFFNSFQAGLHFFGPPAVMLVEEGAQCFGLRLLDGGQIGPARQEVGGQGRGQMPIQESFGQRVIGL